MPVAILAAQQDCRPRIVARLDHVGADEIDADADARAVRWVGGRTMDQVHVMDRGLAGAQVDGLGLPRGDLVFDHLAAA